uniref:Uncharacterized protein n=1 Tax=Panagrolaimus sp. JU765 TaxID=591449 RepID=A0AC34QQ10_9BILA
MEYMDQTGETESGEASTSKMSDEEVKKICFETIQNLLNDPLTDATARTLSPFIDGETCPEPGLPRLLIPLRSVFSNPDVLERAARHLSVVDEEQLQYLLAVMSVSRDMDSLVETFIKDTKCQNAEALRSFVNYLCSLVNETVPSRFRIDNMLALTDEDLGKAEAKLPAFEGVYNDDDWLKMSQKNVRGGLNRVFDSSNITLSNVLQEYSNHYREKQVRDVYECTKNSEKFKLSDSKYHRASEIADVPDYSRMYQILSCLVGCRMFRFELSGTETAIIEDIFQEMEEVIALNFDNLARQMPILKAQVDGSELTPKMKFSKDEVYDIESNTFQLPPEFKNIYEFEKMRRKAQKLPGEDGQDDENGYHLTEL